MASRLELQAKLEQILGSENVYFQPPEGYKLKYPCIVYKRRPKESRYADNAKYLKLTSYDVQLIRLDPDEDNPYGNSPSSKASPSDFFVPGDPIFAEIENLPYCRHDRVFVVSNLTHDNFVLYY